MIFVPRTDRSIVGNWWWTVDRTMLSGVGLLAVIGTILIFAASPAVGERVYGAEMHFVVKHLVMLVPATCLLLFVSMLAPSEVYTNSLRGELVRTEKDMGLRVVMTPAEMMEKTKREDELGVATFTP